MLRAQGKSGLEQHPMFRQTTDSGFRVAHLRGKQQLQARFLENYKRINPDSASIRSRWAIFLCFWMPGERTCALTSRFTVKGAIGKTIMIHGGADSFTFRLAGYMGGKIARDVIR